MGRSYLFECSKCGYKAKVSGRADEGADVAVQTVLCHDCKKLYDAVIRVKRVHGMGFSSFNGFTPARFLNRRNIFNGPPSFDSALNRLPLPGGARAGWHHFKLRCPTSSVHKVQIWNDPGRCPRCGAFMEKGVLPFRLWE